MYTLDDIRDLRAAAFHYRLNCRDLFWLRTDEDLKKICNGAGPEKWSYGKRKALTEALKRYEPAFAIHDEAYSAPQTISRSEADKQLKENMIKIWQKDFGFWRYFSRAGRVERFVIIPAVYHAVCLGGNEAWEEAAND